MKNQKSMFKKITVFIMSVLFLLTSTFSGLSLRMVFAEDETPSVKGTIPFTLELDEEAAAETVTYTFEISAAGEGAATTPMPDPAVVTMTAAGSSSFPEITFTEPGDYYYTVKQTTVAPHGGYVVDNTEYSVRAFVYWDDTNVVNEGDKEELKVYFIVHKTNEEEKTDIVFKNTSSDSVTVSITKIWRDDDNQDGYRLTPEEYKAKVHLMIGSEEVTDVTPTVTANSDGTYTVTYSNLPKRSGDGTIIEYTVKEDGVDHYSADKTTVANGESITNTHESEKTEIPAKKIWNDNNDQDRIRPTSIMFRLFDGEKEIASKTVTEQEDWAWTFTDLPKNREGKPIEYRVTEDRVDNYSTTSTYDEEEGYTFTNTYTPGKTSLTVSKVWDDADDQDGIRPASIQVTLLADGTKASVDDAEVTLDESNQWTYTWQNLDEKKDGQTIAYTVEEVDVTKYDTKITGTAETGYIITNSYTPEETKIFGQKVWDDKDNKDGKRPSHLIIYLYADGEQALDKTGKAITQDIVADKDGNWNFEFTGLAKNKDGKEIQYSVQEETVKEYKASYSGSASSGFTIKNSYTPKEEPPTPPTGDTNHLLIYVILMAAAAVLIAGVLIIWFAVRRKKNR